MTVTVIVSRSVSTGVPSSVTTTSKLNSPGPSASVGVHENAPVTGSIDGADRCVLQRERQHVGGEVGVGRHRRERQPDPLSHTAITDRRLNTGGVFATGGDRDRVRG